MVLAVRNKVDGGRLAVWLGFAVGSAGTLTVGVAALVTGERTTGASGRARSNAPSDESTIRPMAVTSTAVDRSTTQTERLTGTTMHWQ